jgi:hypothetical protein
MPNLAKVGDDRELKQYLGETALTKANLRVPVLHQNPAPHLVLVGPGEGLNLSLKNSSDQLMWYELLSRGDCRAITDAGQNYWSDSDDSDPTNPIRQMTFSSHLD